MTQLPKMASKVAVRAVNDFIGHNVLFLLAFTLLPFQYFQSSVPTAMQRERMEFLATVRAEMNATISQIMIMSSLIRDTPPAAHRTYKMGGDLLIYSQKEKKF